jgi:hypothetical protein
VAGKVVDILITAKDFATKKVKGLSKALLSLKGIIAGGVGLLALRKAYQLVIKSAADTEAQTIKLATAMKAAGRFTKEAFDENVALAEQLEVSTGIVSEEIIQVQAILQSFGRMTHEEMNKTVPAVLNLATVMGIDTASAAVSMGKAFVGQLGSLKRYGVSVDKATFQTEGFNHVLDVLATEQGGQAEARMQGFGGAIRKVAVEIENILKRIGSFIIENQKLRDTVMGVAAGVSALKDRISEFLTTNQKLLNEVIEGFAIMAIAAGKAFGAVAKFLAKAAAGWALLTQKIFGSNKAVEENTKKVKDNTKASGDALAVKIKNLQAEGLSQRAISLTLGLERLRIEQTKAFNNLLNLQLAKRKETSTEAIKIFDKQIATQKQRLDESIVAIKTAEDERLKIYNETNESLGKNEKETLKGLRKQRDDLILTDLEKLDQWRESVNDISIKSIEGRKLIEEIYNEELRKIRADRLEDEIAANEDSQQAHIDALNKIGEARKQDDALRLGQQKEFIQNRLNQEIQGKLQELNALKQLQSEVDTLETAANRKKLEDDTLNQAERRELLLTYQESLEEVLKKAGEVGTDSAKEVLELFNEFKKLQAEVKGTEVGKELQEGFEEGTAAFKELTKNIEKTKPTIELDIESMKIQLATDAVLLGKILKKGIQEELNRGVITVPVSGTFNGISFTGE